MLCRGGSRGEEHSTNHSFLALRARDTPSTLLVRFHRSFNTSLRCCDCDAKIFASQQDGGPLVEVGRLCHALSFSVEVSLTQAESTEVCAHISGWIRGPRENRSRLRHAPRRHRRAQVGMWPRSPRSALGFRRHLTRVRALSSDDYCYWGGTNERGRFLSVYSAPPRRATIASAACLRERRCALVMPFSLMARPSPATLAARV